MSSLPKQTTSLKCNTSDLKVGTKYSRISYGEVIDKNQMGIRVRNEEGLEWTISEEVVEQEFFTPDQFDELKEVTRTEMVQAIVGNPRIVMTVTFKKQADAKELRDLVSDMLKDVQAGGKVPGPRTLSRKLKIATEGETRVMVGRHAGSTDEFGRLHFTDMEAKGHNLRLVDPRTVEEAILGNVKYKVKGK